MKRIRQIFTLVIFSVLAPCANMSQAAVLLTEDFESTTFDRSPEGVVGEGYCDNGLTECSTAVAGCVNCSVSPNRVSIQSAVVHRGTKAIKGEFLGSYVPGNPAGNCGAAGFKILNDGAQSYGKTLPPNIWIRFYVRFDPSLRFNDSGNKIVDTGFNFYFTGNRYGNDHRLDLGVYASGFSGKSICNGGAVTDLATMREKRQCTNGDGSAWVIDTMNPDHTSGWWYFEINFDTVGNRFSLWAKRPRDSSVTQIYNNEAWTFPARWNGQELYFGWWNFCSAPRGGGGTIYYDDVAIGDSYIGPTEGGSTLLTPTNLRVAP